MADLPWAKFYWGDYWGKTRHFTRASLHGVYTMLIGYQCMNGPISPDLDMLRGLCQATPEEWAKDWPVIERFFKRDAAGNYVHPKAMAIWEERTRKKRKSRRRSEAGKKGAAARWGAEAPAKPAQRKKSGPGDDVVAAVDLYNAMAETAKLPTCQKLSKARAGKIEKRLKEVNGIEGWKVALEKTAASAFLTGKTSRDGWIATIDFLAQEAGFTKIMEGFYDDRKPTRPNGRAAPPTESERRQAILDGLGIEPGMDTSRWPAGKRNAS